MGKIENHKMILSDFGKIVEREWHESFALGREFVPIRKPKSISSFIAGFKSRTTNKIDDLIDEMELPIKNFNRNNKFWQSNYHDHIICNEKAYQNIKTYIINNPAKWNDDKFH